MHLYVFRIINIFADGYIIESRGIQEFIYIGIDGLYLII